MSDTELQSEDNGYQNGSNDSEGNEDIQSKEEEDEQESANSEMSDENEEEDSEEDRDEDDSDSEQGLKRRRGENSMQSKRQKILSGLVDSEATSSDSEGSEKDKSYDEVYY